jgi:hypothetical protein
VTRTPPWLSVKAPISRSVVRTLIEPAPRPIALRTRLANACQSQMGACRAENAQVVKERVGVCAACDHLQRDCDGGVHWYEKEDDGDNEERGRDGARLDSHHY